MQRTIIFGDIHGCLREWEDLLKKTGASSKDRLISVGDLVNKGPKGIECLDAAMSMKNLTCVVGNHEYALLNHWKEKKLSELHKPYQKETVKAMGKKLDHYMQFLDTWPYYLDFPDFSVVHAGIRPGIPLAEQRHHDLVYMRALPETEAPWYESYTDKKLIVHGHWASKGLVIRENVIGLDSGCVYGKKLSCVILPGREIVSVDAHKAYAPIS